MTSLIYNTGTVTVSNGSAVVTGNLTGWSVALVTGGMFSCAGMAVPIASIESDTSLTLAYAWPGTSGAGKAYAVARDYSEAVRATWTNDRLAKLAQRPWGVGVIPDGRGTLAERDAVTPLPNDNYCWLRIEADQPAELYFRDGGVWLGPYDLKGDQGDAGPIGAGLVPMGAWSAATSYDIGQYVTYSGRAFASLVDGNIGNQPPATATDNAYWMYVPAPGGDFVGPANSADGEVVLFNGATGKLGKRGPLIQTSTTDATAGRLLTVGAFGIGTQAISTETDLNNYKAGGTFVTPNVGLTNLPSGWAQGRYVLAVDGGANYAMQTISNPTSGATAIRVWGGVSWSAWLTDVYSDAIGVTVQAYNARLASIAGLTMNSGQFIRMAGNNTAVAQDIVGTVSQSGGIPTGAIVERGSNANGEYVRFADGTQICALNTTVTDQAIDSAYGSLFQGARVWTYPSVFAAAPGVVCGGKWGAGRSWGALAGNPLTTNVTLAFIDIASRASGTSMVISAWAIGKWF